MFVFNICPNQYLLLSVGASYLLQNGIEVPTDLVTGKPRTDLLFLKSPFT
jgi:hypothetical protein